MLLYIINNKKTRILLLNSYKIFIIKNDLKLTQKVLITQINLKITLTL